MKRLFPAVLGLCLILAALAMTDTLRTLDYDTLTVYDNGKQTVYTASQTVPPTRGKYVRVDMTGDVDSVLKTLNAHELFRETFDGVTVVYAFTTCLSAYETVHDRRVNLMIAVRGDRLAIGSPLLKGSY